MACDIPASIDVSNSSATSATGAKPQSHFTAASRRNSLNPRLTWMLSNRIFLTTLASICCLYGLVQLKAHGYSADKISQSRPLYEYSNEQLSQPSEQLPFPGADFSVVNQHSSSLAQEQCLANTTQIAQSIESRLHPRFFCHCDDYEGLTSIDDIVSNFFANFGSYLRLKLHDIYGLLWPGHKSPQV